MATAAAVAPGLCSVRAPAPEGDRCGGSLGGRSVVVAPAPGAAPWWLLKPRLPGAAAAWKMARQEGRRPARARPAKHMPAQAPMPMPAPTAQQPGGAARTPAGPQQPALPRPCTEDIRQRPPPVAGQLGRTPPPPQENALAKGRPHAMAVAVAGASRPTPGGGAVPAVLGPRALQLQGVASLSVGSRPLAHSARHVAQPSAFW